MSGRGHSPFSDFLGQKYWKRVRFLNDQFSQYPMFSDIWWYDMSERQSIKISPGGASPAEANHLTGTVLESSALSILFHRQACVLCC